MVKSTALLRWYAKCFANRSMRQSKKNEVEHRALDIKEKDSAAYSHANDSGGINAVNSAN